MNQNQSEYDSNLKLIKLKINELNLLNNIYIDQNFEINFNENESKASFNGNNLNGTFIMDSTGFARIDVFDTKFEFKGINSFESNQSFDFKNINSSYLFTCRAFCCFILQQFFGVIGAWQSVQSGPRLLSQT